MKLNREPIINTAAVLAAIGVFVRWAVSQGWVHWNDGQIAAIMTVAAIVLPLLVGIIGRQWVSPVGQKVAAVLSEAETIAAKPETKAIVKEGASIIDNVMTHAPAEGQAVAVAAAPVEPTTAPATVPAFDPHGA